jgi:hypothetical protein
MHLMTDTSHYLEHCATNNPLRGVQNMRNFGEVCERLDDSGSGDSIREPCWIHAGKYEACRTGQERPYSSPKS